DGGFRIPVAFRLWRPKRACAPGPSQTKLQLAAQLLTELVAARLPFQYLVMDTHYTAGWFTHLAGRLGICWVGPLPPRTTVLLRGLSQAATHPGRRALARLPRRGFPGPAPPLYAPHSGRERVAAARNPPADLRQEVPKHLGAE